MGKVVGTVVALALLLAAVLAPAWLLWDDDPAVAAARAGLEDLDPTTITDYDATFELVSGGDLVVEEQLTLVVPASATRAGLTRWFDRVDDSDERVRRRVEDVTATLDGAPVALTLDTAAHGRFDVATIGDPDVAVEPGEHRYVIRYRVPHALEPGYGDSPSSLHWDLVPWSWPQDIAAAELTVRLPADALAVQCGIGRGEDPAPCDDVVGEGTDTLEVLTGPLPDHTPVRVRLGVAAPRSDVPHLPWKPRLDVVLGQDPLRLALVLAAALLAGLVGLLVARLGRERAPRPAAAGAAGDPPGELGPAQAAYVLEGRGARVHYVASLVLAGQQGAVDITRRDTGWTVTDRSGAYGWSGLDPVTGRVAHLLGGPGSSFVVDPAGPASGGRLRAELAAFAAYTAEWARAAGLVETRRSPRPGALLAALAVAVALAATVVAVVWDPLDMSVTALVPGLFALAALRRLDVRPAPRRTPAGREAWARVRGLDRALAGTDGEGPSLAGDEGRYAALLPWAVALGRADAWAARYRAETGQEPPAVPSAAVVAELDAAVAEAVAAHDVPRALGAGGHRRRGVSRARRRRAT